MKVHYERSGGFGNITITGNFDTQTLLPSDAKELEELISAAKVFDLQPDVAAPSRLPDDLQHLLRVESGSRTQTLRRNDSDSSPELMILFDWLYEKAVQRPH